MADDYGVQGLNGNEIIADTLAQLKKRLEGDCNLRPHDGYSRGYSAKITYHLECYGLDKTEVDGEFDAGTAHSDPDADIEDGTLEIEQEQDLDEVRDRIKSDSGAPPQDEEDENPNPSNAAEVRAKRKYTRKVQLTSPGIIGGTEDFKE